MSKLSLKVTRYMLWCWNVTQSDSHSSEGHILGAPMQVPSSVYMVNLMQTGLVVEEVNNMGLGWSQFLLFKELYFLSDILYCQHHHHTSWVHLSFAFEDIQSIKPFWNIKTGKKKIKETRLNHRAWLNNSDPVVFVRHTENIQRGQHEHGNDVCERLITSY